MTLTSHQRARRLRLSGSILIAAATLGPLLIGSALYSQGTVRRAANDVLRAEAEDWGRAIGGRARAVGGPVTRDLLDTFLEEGWEAGLRHVAYVERDGARLDAGTPASPYREDQLRGQTHEWVGPRVRFAVPSRNFSARPPRPAGPWADALQPWRPNQPQPPGNLRRGSGRPSAWLVVEFEPRLFPQLMNASRRTLALGSLTSAAVVLLALWVWQSVRRRYAMERETERARHLAALGEMSAVLAHEIRNPLASLKGHAQLLHEGLDGAGLERPRTKAARVVDEAVRIERITTDLLDFVREGKLALAPTDLGALVRLSTAEVVPAERLRLALPAAPLEVPVDAARIRQVLENLARNAVQAGDGAVEIAVTGDADEAVITVRDHGPGIPAGREEEIFTPFMTTRTRGTGLGLAIARRIVDRHGGSVVGANHPEGGALFRVTLPRVPG